MNPWNVDLVEPCSIDICQTEPGRPFHCFIFWNGTKESAHASADSPAKAISQAYVNRCSLWLGDPGEPMRPANVIEPQELIETPVVSKELLRLVSFVLFMAALWLIWRLA